MRPETRAAVGRWGKRFGKAALILVAGLLGLAGVALAVLGTSFGGERVRRVVLPRINQAIAGHLEIGRLRVHLTGLELFDLSLSDPEGHVVAQVAHLEVAALARRLLSHQVELSAVLIERPSLFLLQSRRGLNLTRALAPRSPAPPAPAAASPAPWRLVLGQLSLSQGVVDFRDSTPQGAAPVRVERLEVQGAGSLALASGEFAGRLAVTAQTLAPLAAPFALRIETGGRGAAAQAGLQLEWGAARIDLRVDSQNERRQTVEVAQIAVPPALLRAFVPTAPLRAMVATRGRITRQGDRIDVALDLDAGDAHGDLRAAVDLARRETGPVHLALERIDLGQLIVGAPPSRFDLLLEGQGGGPDLQHAAGHLRLQVPPGKLDGRSFGPLRVEAEAGRGQYLLRALELALPGLTASARGEGSERSLQAEAKVVASDLALLARSLRLPASLGLAGHGQLALTLSGRPAAPRLSVGGQFPSLRILGNDLVGLTLSAASADLRAAPAGTNLRVRLAHARAGQTMVRDLDLALVSQGRDGLRVQLTVAAPLPLALTATGRSSRPQEGVQIIDLDSLSLAYPEATWRLVKPVRLRSAGDELALGALELQAAEQRLQIDLTRRGSRINAHAGLAHVDLGRLPALLQPPGNRVTGLVDASVQLTGRLPRPDAKIDLHLGAASVGKFKNLGLTLAAQHRGGRVQGTLAASALGANHSASFDLPVLWPPPPSARLQLRAALGEIDLAQLAVLGKTGAAPPPALSGKLAATLELEGPASDPDLALTAIGRQLRAGGAAADTLEQVRLVVRDPVGKPLQVEVQTSILGRQSHLDLESPIVIGPWLRRPPDRAALLAIPFRIRADVDKLPLSALSTRAGGRPDFSGTVSAHAVLTGPAPRLHGTLALDADEVKGPGLPATSARLQTRLGEGGEGLDARLTVSRQGLPIAALTAALGVGLDDLLARRSLAHAKVQIKGHVGPLGLQRLVAGAESGRKDRRALRADVEADLTASGTLGDPRCELRLAVQEAKLASRPLGNARLQLVYRDANPTLNLQMTSAGGGEMTLSARAKVDLSLPAVMRGITPAQIPIDATLAARALDLAFLSGVQDDVRTVEGRLQADARVKGLVGAPQLVGKLAWQAGRLVLAGFGEMRDIELSARGDAHEMVLDRLFARSGSGTATVSGKAVRDAGGALALDAGADVKRFRVQTDGQALGDLSLAARAKGHIAPGRIDIATTISEARMELAEGDRRNLQSLKRPDDVVLLVNGEPLDKAQAQRYEKLVKPPPAPRAPASAAAPSSAPGTELSVTVDAPRNLWARGADANLEVGLDPGFLIRQADEIRIFGTVRVKRGYVEVLSRRFDVTPGSSVRFTGSADRPSLSIDAVYKSKTEDSSTVVVHVEGSADKFAFTLRSPEHPEYGDSELLALIATGRLPNGQSKGGTTADAKAKSLVGGLVASRVQKVLTTHLPIDVLLIEPGDEVSGSRLEAGTYLRDDVYVAYVGRVGGDPLGRENRNELHLEYQLNPRWSFEATYGDARRGSVDLLWTRNY